MTRELKIWNGRGICCRTDSDPRWKDVPWNRCGHAYVAAYSREDARRVIEEYTGEKPSVSELRDYWAEGCWGRAMDGIEVERGLWISFDERSTPERVV